MDPEPTLEERQVIALEDIAESLDAIATVMEEQWGRKKNISFIQRMEFAEPPSIVPLMTEIKEGME